MRIVLAPDSFKGSLPAAEFCRVAAAAIQDLRPDAEVISLPMADGGEGTAAALLAARPVAGEWVPVRVTGPTFRSVGAGYAWFPGDATAVVEMAAASGLPLVPPAERDPLATTTYGTGELLRAAQARGARRILLAVGGSATVDGGIGAAAALGWQFEDADGRAVPPTGGGLERLRRIVPPAAMAPFPPVEVLCDVNNPLTGPDGAAAVYGPQKGATPEMVARLDRGLARLAACVRDQLGVEIETPPGAGAAGGLAAGAMAFLRGRLVPGIRTLLEEAGFDAAIGGADWVVTGEGRLDAQSLCGKVVSGVAAAAARRGVPVVVFAGRVALDAAAVRQAGLAGAHAIAPDDLPTEEAMVQAPKLLDRAVRAWIEGLGK